MGVFMTGGTAGKRHRSIHDFPILIGLVTRGAGGRLVRPAQGKSSHIMIEVGDFRPR
jgi:hypothetical protein